MLHGTKLSFIQLGGEIMVGVYQQQKKYYSLVNAPDMLVRRAIGLAV
jgi:hypothetical protein